MMWAVLLQDSSPDQIGSGDWISKCSSTAMYSSNHFLMLVGFAAIALATDKLGHFFPTMSGYFGGNGIAYQVMVLGDNAEAL